MENRCFNCVYWEGDRAVVNEHLRGLDPEAEETFFDVQKGWAPSGECSKILTCIDVTIHGNAYCTLDVFAGFSCKMFEKNP